MSSPKKVNIKTQLSYGDEVYDLKSIRSEKVIILKPDEYKKLTETIHLLRKDGERLAEWVSIYVESEFFTGDNTCPVMKDIKIHESLMKRLEEK